MSGRLVKARLDVGTSFLARSYDDGRMIFKNRVSDYPGVGLLVSDSLSYDKADHLVRGWQQVYQQNPDQTLISYDGLGAVVAREQGSLTGLSNVEEFRNDAFGNVVRKLNRRSAGLINNAPFAMSYSIKRELTSSSALLKTPPESQYQRQDDLGQTFLNGEMIKQGEVIRNPTSGDYDYQLATRNYYSADDRLMAVQKYSWRPAGVRDGTWEEYRYDALGRRIMTRARRDTTGSYPAATSGPLCQSATIPLCRSFVEMVWWDGDQALLENRIPEGTSDVSNSGAVGNVHGLTLDEPLAVYTTNPFTEARIIDYNWRGQGLSSVYPSGVGADFATGSSLADIDWPAMTQAETYFTPSLDAPANDNHPKKWMGTFVQNGQGTTGMLYRRNRYFDPNTGRFTQEDPIGIAGGVNAYGFAAGDPVNFSDPFGLCPPCGANPLEPRMYQSGLLGTLLAGIGGAAEKLRERHGDEILTGIGMLLTEGWSAIADDAPLLGRNPRLGGNRINTDLPGDRAVGKSIFRQMTKGQTIETQVMPDGTIRRFTKEGIQIRMAPGGKTNLDLPRGPLGKEDVHIKPPL